MDFPAIHAFLRGKKYKGWILLDYLPPRPSDNIGTFEQSIARNKEYLVKVLGVNTLGPTEPGYSSCEYGCMGHSALNFERRRPLSSPA